MRTITVAVVDAAELRNNPFEWSSQEEKARQAKGQFRPLTKHEWDRIERRIHQRRSVRKPVGLRGAPRPQLADGRFVDDVLDARP